MDTYPELGYEPFNLTPEELASAWNDPPVATMARSGKCLVPDC